METQREIQIRLRITRTYINYCISRDLDPHDVSSLYRDMYHMCMALTLVGKYPFRVLACELQLSYQQINRTAITV